MTRSTITLKPWRFAARTAARTWSSGERGLSRSTKRPIALAETIYAAHPTGDTLARYRDIVFESAEFMASYAHYDAQSARYVLGPPVIPAQENHPPRETWNPTFELEYWDHALGIAQRWRERAGLARQPKWDEVRAKLSALPVKDGVYLAHENCPQTFTER